MSLWQCGSYDRVSRWLHKGASNSCYLLPKVSPKTCVYTQESISSVSFGFPNSFRSVDFLPTTVLPADLSLSALTRLIDKTNSTAISHYHMGAGSGLEPLTFSLWGWRATDCSIPQYLYELYCITWHLSSGKIHFFWYFLQLLTHWKTISQ